MSVHWQRKGVHMYNDQDNIEELELVLRKLGALSLILLSLTLFFFDLTWLCDLPIDNSFSSVPVFLCHCFGIIFVSTFATMVYMVLYWLVVYKIRVNDMFERFWNWLWIKEDVMPISFWIALAIVIIGVGYVGSGEGKSSSISRECVHCNESAIGKYCRNCGRETTPRPRCSQCGNELPARSDRYCRICGKGRNASSIKEEAWTNH